MIRALSCLYILFLIASCNNNSQLEKTTDTVYIAGNTDSVHIESYPLDSLRSDTLNPIMGTIICTESLPIPPITIMNKTFFQRPDGMYDSSINYETISPEQAIAQNLFTCQQFIWEKDTLLVSFTDGDPVVQQRVMATAKKWEEFCSIRFEFGSFPRPDISVSFRYGINKSCIGNTSPYQTPSMMLTGLRRTSAQEMYDKYVLHEFGHALGMFHEHQNPSVTIPWNIPFLNAYYKQPPNKWDSDEVRKNIIEKPPFTNCSGSDFDKESIMIYEISPKMVTDSRFVTKSPTKLSIRDIATVKNFYPR